MPRHSTLARPRETGAVRAARAAHTLESTTYHPAVYGAVAGWGVRCSCGGSPPTRFPDREAAVSAHTSHVRRSMPAGT